MTTFDTTLTKIQCATDANHHTAALQFVAHYILKDSKLYRLLDTFLSHPRSPTWSQDREHIASLIDTRLASSLSSTDYERIKTCF